MSDFEVLDFSGWEWIFAVPEAGPGIVFDPLGSLTFARGLIPDRAVTVAEMFEAFGLDPTAAFPATRAQAFEAVQPPTVGDQAELLRVAVCGEWTVAIEPAGIRLITEGTRLSHAAREVFGMTFVTIEGMVNWRYARDGIHRASGDPLALPTMGPDAEHFAALLRAAGLPRVNVEPVPPPGSTLRAEEEHRDHLWRRNQEWAENIVGTLAVLGREIGFSLPAEVYQGPLPTSTQRLSRPQDGR